MNQARTPTSLIANALRQNRAIVHHIVFFCIVNFDLTGLLIIQNSSKNQDLLFADRESKLKGQEVGSKRNLNGFPLTLRSFVIFYVVGAEDPYFRIQDTGRRALMLKIHANHLLGLTISGIEFLASIRQNLLLTSIASKQIDVLFISTNGAFISVKNNGIYLFKLSINTDCQSRTSRHKDLPLSVKNTRVQQKNIAQKRDRRGNIWQLALVFLNLNYSHSSLQCIVDYLLALCQICEQTISLLFAFILLSKSQIQLEKSILFPVPHSNVI